MSAKSKILVIGGMGYIGKFIVEASAKAGHETFALVRETTVSNPDKLKIVHKFQALGIKLVLGDLYDIESLVNAIKQVDVVISAVGIPQLADQIHIISAIKQAGNVKVQLIIKKETTKNQFSTILIIYNCHTCKNTLGLK